MHPPQMIHQVFTRQLHKTQQFVVVVVVVVVVSFIIWLGT
jgi:hypothetical protein